MILSNFRTLSLAQREAHSPSVTLHFSLSHSLGSFYTIDFCVHPQFFKIKKREGGDMGGEKGRTNLLKVTVNSLLAKTGATLTEVHVVPITWVLSHSDLPHTEGLALWFTLHTTMQ